MLKTKKIFLAALIAFMACSSTIIIKAQTDSPYSRYGLGKLRDQATGPSKGMGGAGYGLNTQQSANPMNPASYAQVDSLTFVFDIGIDYTRGTFEEGGNKSSKNNGGLDYITLLFPVSKRIGISAGILPYSSVGYNLGTKNTVQDQVTGNEVDYKVDHLGSGGLSQVYLGMGYKSPIQGLSAGLNVSYLFGKLRYTNAVTQISQVANLSTQYTQQNLTTVKIDLGVQYKLKLKEDDFLTLGAVYTPKINSRGKLLRTRYQSNSTEEEVVNDQTIDAGTPHMAGLGLAYDKNSNLLLAADITYQRWKGVKFSELHGDGLSSDKRFNNRWKFAMGAEYRASSYSKNYLQRMKFRGGVNFSNSYVNVNTVAEGPKGYDEYGASIGFGLPITDTYGLGRRTSYVNITFEYKYLKPALKSMVTEKYFGVTFNMNVNELWFLQRKIQ